MKAKYLFLVGFFFIAGNVWAQGLFHKKYLQPVVASQLLQIDKAGNIYVATDVTINGVNKLALIKTDSSGNIIWDKELGFDTLCHYIQDFLIMPDQKIILVGEISDCVSYDQGLITCLDSSGNLLYTKILGSTNEFHEINNIILDSVGFTISINDLNPTGVEFLKFNENGNLISEKILNINKWWNILKRPDGNYLFYYNSSDGGGSFVVGLIDSGFNNFTLIASLYPLNLSKAGTAKMIYINDNTSYLLGQADLKPAIIHVNKELKCDWVKQFSFAPMIFNPVVMLIDLHLLSDGTWLFLGFDWLDEHKGGNYFLMHTDSAFNPLNIKYLSLLSVWVLQFDLNKSEMINDNLLFTQNLPDTSNAYNGGSFEILKTDTTFSGICDLSNAIIQGINLYHPDNYSTYNGTAVDTTITITNINLPIKNVNPIYGLCSDTHLSISEILNYNNNLNIYPSPATDLLHISLNKNIIPNESGDEVNIFNVIGEKVYTDVITGNEKTINCHLAAGVYFVQVSDDERVYTGKVIIE